MKSEKIKENEKTASINNLFVHATSPRDAISCPLLNINNVCVDDRLLSVNVSKVSHHTYLRMI